MNISITGHTGFIGSTFTSRVTPHHQISLLDRGIHDMLRPDSLKTFLSGADCVVHLAGANRASDIDLVTANTSSTIGLLEGMRKFSPKAKIIFASSFQVYGMHSLYAFSKIWAEEAIQFSSASYHIPGIILRLSNVYGPGCKPFYNSVIATYCYQISRGEAITVHGEGTQKRDYIYIDDVVDAFVRCLSYRPSHDCETFDICSSSQVSLSEVINILTSFHASRIQVTHTKNEGIDVEYPHTDASPAYHAFSWKAETPLEKGLQQTLTYETSRKKT